MQRVVSASYMLHKGQTNFTGTIHFTEAILGLKFGFTQSSQGRKGERKMLSISNSKAAVNLQQALHFPLSSYKPVAFSLRHSAFA
jgi:hypothetical protein